MTELCKKCLGCNKLEDKNFKGVEECEYFTIEQLKFKLVEGEQMKTTQKDRILEYIRNFGSISSFEAYANLGITQLGARIDQLKKEGYEFKTEWESNTNRFGEKTDYKRYYLADMISENMEHITQM